MEVVKRICDLCGTEVKLEEGEQHYRLGYVTTCNEFQDLSYVSICVACCKVVLPKVKALLKEHNTVGPL